MALVPARTPALSPKERVIAKPGSCAVAIHTRYGPIGLPVSSVCASTRPELRIIYLQTLIYVIFNLLAMASDRQIMVCIATNPPYS
jgi:hypothetical protein